jgi:hypothetical protein
MSRKDYVLIAEAIKISKEANPEEQSNCLAYLVGNLQARLLRENPNFKEDIFRKACGF